ncbi:MAG: hypothetical protein JWM59_4069 [Verrucomicrobiales bacterium]|nr:hypothetical protein [Verrucomicrobiales bacterium]
MDFQIWINQSRELSERLEAAVPPGAVALAALDLARHRNVLAAVDWCGQVLNGPVENLLTLTEELPPRIQLPIRVIAAAAWLQGGRTGDSRRVVDSMMGFEVWPMPGVIPLFLPWAVLLADQPGLLPLWQVRARHHGDEVVELLAAHAPDEALRGLLETGQATQDYAFMDELIGSMKNRRRLKALQEFSCVLILDHEEEIPSGCLSGAWIRQHIQQAVGELLVVRATETRRREEMPPFLIPSSAESQESEAMIYYQEHFPVWRESLCHSAGMAKNIALLQLVLQTPPDESCSIDYWWHAASALTEETRLEKVWPFICGADDRIWREISIHAENIVERAVQTGELELAAELVNRIPSREAHSLRVRLERATAKAGTALEGDPAAVFLEAGIQAVREARLEEAASYARSGIAAAKGIRNIHARRETLFRLAACLICTPAAKEAFKIVLQYTKNAVDSDDAVKRYFEFIECCEGLDALELLVRSCAAAGERWYELYSPNSLMNLAVARIFYKQGFQPAVDLCRNLPEAAADEGLDMIHQCEGWDNEVADVVQLMREWGNGKIAPHHCMNQVRRVEQKGNWEKAAELARLLIMEMDAQEGEKAAAAADLLKDFLDAAPAGGTSGSWPSVRSGVKEITRIFPMPPWREIRGDEFMELTEGLSRNRSAFDQF